MREEKIGQEDKEREWEEEKKRTDKNGVEVSRK